MKKVRFFVGTRYVRSEVSEIVEFDDDATDEEIDQEFETWVWENIDAGWGVVKN